MKLIEGFGKSGHASFPAALLSLVLALCFGQAGAANSIAEPDLLEAEKAFPVTARRVGDNAIELRYAIAAGYYMYRDRFRFAVNGQPVVLEKKAFPAGKIKQDATFGRVTTYRNSVRLLLPVSATIKELAASREPLMLVVTSQGCADAGVCYPPLHQTLVLPAGTSAWTSPQEQGASGFSRDQSPGSGLADRLTGGK